MLKKADMHEGVAPKIDTWTFERVYNQKHSFLSKQGAFDTASPVQCFWLMF